MKWLTALVAVALIAACSSSGGTTQDPGTGPAVESLVSTELPVGNANCPAGGHFFTFNDGKTAYVCNGLNGAKGDKGDTGLQGLKGDTGLQGIQGPKGDTGPSGGPDPSVVATLRWDLAPVAYGVYPVGSQPASIAFDGTNIWVVNFDSNNVTKLKASDGSLVGTYTVGAFPFGIAFDGTNIWVANATSNNVTRLKASDGSLVGTYGVGASPVGIAFDGTSIWVSNYYSNNVTKLPR
jgi:hypothetical protein